MGKTIYFAKVNINDERVFRLYDGSLTVKEVMAKLFLAMNDRITYRRIIKYKKDGQEHIEEQDFTFTGLNKFDGDVNDVLVGGVIKTAKIYINKVDKRTGEKTTVAMDNDEVVRFCFYPTKEIVAFDSTNRFGYQTFCRAFEGLLSKASKLSDEDNTYFKVSLLTNGVSLEDIKEELKNIKNIEMLKIDIIPPNPNKDILEKIRANGEKRLRSMEEGRITERSVIFRSRDERGLNSEAQEIVDELDNMSAIHSQLTVEEATGNGYVEVEAVSRDGSVYNTNESKIIKDRLPNNIIGDKMFADYCKTKIVIICN